MSNEIHRLDEQIKRLERDKKIYERSLSKLSRKERTHRLIQIGALSEKYFDLYQNNIEDIEEMFSQFSLYVRANKLDKHKKGERNQ